MAVETLPPTELTSPVAVATPEGTFNAASHGWARQPIVDTTRIDGTQFVGRNRRWEYWCVLTPSHYLAFSLASLDFTHVFSVWILDRATKEEINHVSRCDKSGVVLPGNVEDGPARGRDPEGKASIDIEQEEGGTRLRVIIPGASWDVFAALPDKHERLAVVVPWDNETFQYTIKDVSRPATGTLTIGDTTTTLTPGESWAILDHGRGRWPADVHWNWGAGSGRAKDGRVIGLQGGDKWTDGTGSTENSFLLGTRLYKLGKVTWEYDTDDYMKPWRIHGGGLDATLTCTYNKTTRIDTERYKNSTDQVFGTWKGTFDTGDEVVEFDGVDGFAEDVFRKW